MVRTKASGEVESRRRRRTGTPGSRMACPTPRMLVGHTQHHPLSVPDEQINHGKRNSGPQGDLRTRPRASEHRPTPSMVVP